MSNNKESDFGHAGRPGMRGGSAVGPIGTNKNAIDAGIRRRPGTLGGAEVGPIGTDENAIAAGIRRQAMHIEQKLEPHEEELLRQMDANDPEIKTRVLKNGKMVDDGGDFNKW